MKYIVVYHKRENRAIVDVRIGINGDNLVDLHTPIYSIDKVTIIDKLLGIKTIEQKICKYVIKAQKWCDTHNSPPDNKKIPDQFDIQKCLGYMK